MRWLVSVVALAGVFLGVSSGADAHAQDDETPRTPVLDPSVVLGPRVLYTPRPRPARDARFCGVRVPVCVHATMPAHDGAALGVLDAFDRAWATMTGALELPPPDVDPDTGAYDVFLAAAEDPILEGELATTSLEARDVRSRIDRARSFTTVDARVRPGCVLDALASRALARASLFRAAPATDEGTARAQATFLAGLATPCATALLADAAQRFQSHPELTFCDPYAGAAIHAPDEPPAPPSRASTLFSRGASLVWSRLDWAFARAPGGLVLATWALAPTTTAIGARRWDHEPDVFDVLRESFKDRLSTGSTIHDLLLDIAVARAFMGSADDGLHAPETRALGDSALVALDWDLPWPAKPKRVAPRAAVHPSGASYIAIRRDGAPAGSRLRIEITWEQHALFRWAAVKVDRNGRELGRIVVPTPPRATDAQISIVDLDGVDRVLLVGTNAGDPAYAFDPDEAVWEPHAWLVTIAAE